MHGGQTDVPLALADRLLSRGSAVFLRLPDPTPFNTPHSSLPFQTRDAERAPSAPLAVAFDVEFPRHYQAKFQMFHTLTPGFDDPCVHSNFDGPLSSRSSNCLNTLRRHSPQYHVHAHLLPHHGCSPSMFSGYPTSARTCTC